MARGKARYDGGTTWKFRQYSTAELSQIVEQLRAELRPLYAASIGSEGLSIGRAFDEWVAAIAYEAQSAISTSLRLGRRHSKEDLHAEQSDLLKKIRSAELALRNVSADLSILLGLDVDPVSHSEALRTLILPIEHAGREIGRLPRAPKLEDVQHRAAKEMALRCLRLFKEVGGSLGATADKDRHRFSAAVQLLKVVGDQFGLVLDETTWKAVIGEVRPKV